MNQGRISPPNQSDSTTLIRIPSSPTNKSRSKERGRQREALNCSLLRVCDFHGHRCGLSREEKAHFQPNLRTSLLLSLLILLLLFQVQKINEDKLPKVPLGFQLISNLYINLNKTLEALFFSVSSLCLFSSMLPQHCSYFAPSSPLTAKTTTHKQIGVVSTYSYCGWFGWWWWYQVWEARGFK